ncbi:MAG: hypothetical protein FJX06_20705, partial [Alphaproteobacteria bacterium]|nr:hypothetical protein [Alphaproteobacteria bacterium]
MKKRAHKSKKSSHTRHKLSRQANRRVRPGKSAKSAKRKKLPADILAEYETRLDELVRRGRGRGFVTDAEVLNYFPHIEKQLGFLERVYDRLEKEGIKVQEPAGLVGKGARDEVSMEELRRATDVEDALPDAVQMYLKEIGKTPLLTSKEEKELAKRIEQGDET